MAVVRRTGRIGWTSEICAEIQPVSVSASSTITNVTAGLGCPGIEMMASQGRTAPAMKAVPTASASRIGEASEAGVMPCSASACAASASCAVSSMATCRARRRERPRDTYSWVSSSSSASGAATSWTLSLVNWATCWSCSAPVLEYSAAPAASVPARSPANPANMSTFVLTPAPANPSHIPADVRIPSLASGTCGRIHSVILPAAPVIITSPLDPSIRPAHRDSFHSEPAPHDPGPNAGGLTNRGVPGGSTMNGLRHCWLVALAAAVVVVLADCSGSGSNKPAKGPRATPTPSVPANEQAANGPLVGDSSLIAGEQSCAAAEGNAPWYPTIAAFEVHDSGRTHLYDCAHFTGSMSGSNQVFAYSSP